MGAEFLFPWRRLAQTGAALLLMAGLAASPLAARQYPQNNSDTGSAQNANTSAAPAPANQSGVEVPRTFTLPAGTLITVRTSQELSSNQNHPGDSFSAELTQPLVVGGWVVARRGQTVLGRVEKIEKAGRVKGQSKLAIELTRLVLVDGQQFSIETQLVEGSGGTSYARDAATVGTTTAIGAIIGAAASEGDGEGAGIGAAIGAGAGIAGVLLTRGQPTVIPAETLLTFQMQQPVTFSTVGSERAYRPVTQADYNAAPQLQRRVDHIATPPPPYYYPAYPPWGYYGYPPAFFVGYYGFGGYWHRDFDRRDDGGWHRH